MFMSRFFDKNNYRRTEKRMLIIVIRFEDIYLRLQHCPEPVERQLLYVELVKFHLDISHEQFDILMHKMDDVQDPNYRNKTQKKKKKKNLIQTFLHQDHENNLQQLDDYSVNLSKIKSSNNHQFVDEIIYFLS